MQSGWRFRLNT